MTGTSILTEAGNTPAEDKGTKKNLLEHKRSFILHYDEMSVIMELEDAAAGVFLKCMIAYAVRQTGMAERQDLALSDDELQELIDDMKRTDRALNVLFRQFVNYFRQDTSRYSRRVKACRENGRKGGAPRGNTNAGKGYRGQTGEIPKADCQTDAPEREEKTTGNNPKQPEQAHKAKVFAKDRAEVSAEERAEEIMEAPDGALRTALPEKGRCLKIDYRKIMRDFNSRFAGILPEVKTMSETRRKAVQARIREFGRDSIEAVMEKVGKSAFLTGNGNRGWRASFDWIFKPANYAKIAEGNYDFEMVNRMCMPRYESASERERRMNERLKERIFNKAMGHITGVDVAETAERGNGL